MVGTVEMPVPPFATAVTPDGLVVAEIVSWPAEFVMLTLLPAVRVANE